jgi:DNA-binding PadR family transcriptional regulator
MLGGKPFGRRQVSPLQFLMLLQLSWKQKYGYEILKSLREQFKGVWEPRTGTIYPALRSLEARGFVNTVVVEDTEFYSLTGKGEDLLRFVGDGIERDMRFANRYFALVSQWMPKAMKYKVVEMLKRRAEDEAWSPPLLEHFIDDEFDISTKMEVLESIRELLETRLKVVEKRLEELRRGGEN